MDKCLFISKSAILDNVKYYKGKTNKKFIAVVKNNAYGHGIKEVVSILEEADIEMYAVSNLKEANELKQYTNRDILILDRIEDYSNIDNNFVLTVISMKHLKELVKLNITLRIHLKIDTGMKRKGITLEEIEDAIKIINDSKLKIEGIYTHYSHYKGNKLRKEYSLFKQVLDRVYDKKGLIIHASSSISSLLLEESSTNAIRVGIGMYGLKKLVKEMLPLKIASELKCQSKNIYPIKFLDNFSYNCKFYGKKGFIVMINLGYGDGIFIPHKLKGYLDSNYIKEIGIRNMDNMYFYSREYIMDNTIIEIYGKHNKIDDISRRYHIPVCQIMAMLNENIEKVVVN